jgi:anti-anti-sigma factor
MCEPITNETSLEPGHHRQPYLSGACDAAELAAVPPQPFGIEVRLDRGTASVVLSGELDFLAVPVLSERLMPILAAKPRHLVFDMALVTFADCASARLITHAGRYLTAGREPLVKDPAPVVRRIFEVAGFADHCEMTG